MARGVTSRVWLVVVAVLLASAPVEAQAQYRGEWEIISSESDDPAAVAVAWSRVDFPCTVEGRFCPREAVLATSERPVDALGAPLVLKERVPGLGRRRLRGGANGPLLLTASDQLSAPTRAELERLPSIRTVIVLGGPDAISARVEDELRSLDLEIVRIGGATRIETAVATAGIYDPARDYDSEVMVSRAYGDGDDTAVYADAVAAGAYSGFEGIPLLLTDSDELSPPAEEYLRQLAPELSRVSVIGGVDAVSETVLEAIQGLGIPVQRVGGADRTMTAAAIVEGVWPPPVDPEELGYQHFVLEDAYVPAVWASGLSAGGRGPLLFATGADLPAPTRDLLDRADETVGLRCGPLLTAEACDRAAEIMGLE